MTPDSVTSDGPVISPTADSANAKRKHSVLIVDDEEIIRELLQERLGADGGVEAQSVGNGESALKLLETRSFDVVLTDIRMPGMSGIDLLKGVKDKWPETAVLIMSGYAGMSDTIEALRHGAVDFLEKPFEMSRVTEAVGRIFRRKGLELEQKEALRYLERETRTFKIPNNLDLCPIIVSEVTQNLTDKGVSDVSFLESIRVALNEMLFNAIEHGNLGISFEDKSLMMDSAVDYQAAVRERAARPEYVGRHVTLE